jgi:hypothetical protein
MRRMYIRVTQGTGDPSKADEIGALIREMGLPGMRQLPGIQNLYAGVDGATGAVSSSAPGTRWSTRTFQLTLN